MTRQWIVHEVAWPVDTPSAAASFAGTGEIAWLDSAADIARYPHGSRYSLLCARPIAVLEQHDRQVAQLVCGGAPIATDVSGWRLWRRVHARLPSLPALAADVSPGWVGYVGFEMVRQLERLPASHAEDLGLPLLRLALYDCGVVLDHERRQAFAVRAPGVRTALGLDDQPHDADWLARWAMAAEARQVFPPVRALLRYEIDRAAHERAVRRALEYIAAGDIYQVNLAQRLRLEGIGDALDAYAGVRRANPAPYAAVLRWGENAIASVSPELLLRLRAGRVLTRPIKGTRPRTGDPVADGDFRRALLASDKEAAELTMIVDLHRNDLGRVCAYGSVQVLCPRQVEAHPTVLHTVADVVGRLAPGRDALDLLTACFPAGSISGVPKVRALQIIDELEPVARGAYTGAIGLLGLDGQMTFNVAIRTLQIRAETATLHVGGGIVADSDPAAEYEETLSKGAGILSGLGIGPLLRRELPAATCEG